MLDEIAKRRDDFDQADENMVRITLADGQAWSFLKPWYEVRPVFKDGKAKTAYPVASYSTDVDALIAAIGDGSVDPISGVASLAAYLLKLSYDLAEWELNQLLAYRTDDAASLDWTKRVMDVATGEHGCRKGTT